MPVVFFSAAESGIPVQNLQFALGIWAVFMACTAVDKLTGKKGDSKIGSGKTTKSKTVKQSVSEKLSL